MAHAPFRSTSGSLCLQLVMTESRFRQAFLLLLVTAISAAFVAMIRAFLLTILLAAIFAGLSYPVYEWMLGRVRGRKALAAIATLLLSLVLVMGPPTGGARGRGQ
jgi:predicted PurR-regulated permease PerM